MTDQLKLYGLTLAGHIPKEHHGIDTFVRSCISFTLVGYSNAGEPTQWVTITINGICISNVYHPPPAVLNVSLLPSTSDQCIISWISIADMKIGSPRLQSNRQPFG